MKATSEPSTLSFGLLLDGFIIKEWQWQCIQNLLENKNAQLNFIVLNASSYNAESKFKKYTGSKSFYYLYEKHLRKLEMLEAVDLKDKMQLPEVIKVFPEHKKNTHYFAEEELKEIRTKSPDFMLRFGFGIIRGEILQIPKYGIWSFHHGDMKLLRGGPMGIWEILLNHSHQGAVVQKLTNTLDGGIVLREGKITLSKHSAKNNINTILKISADWPAWICKNILLNGQAVIPKIAEQTKASIYKIPTNNKMLLFFFKLFKAKVYFHWQQLFMAEEWNIGILAKSIDSVENTDMKNVIWADQNKNHTYRADPFYIPSPHNRVIFEKYDYKNQKANIASLELKNDRFQKEEKLELELENHLSYPFIFEENGKLHLLPESYTSNKQLHFTFDSKWNKEKDFVMDEHFMDASLLFHEGYYWLFCSKKDQLNNAGLYIYFSKKISATFEPHPLNPVKIDINSARPGGTPYSNEGKLYRPSQNCSKTYGGSIIINEIIRLSTIDFKESFYKELLPHEKSIYKDGLHTLSNAGEYCLVDGKRWIFSFPNFLFQFKRKISKLFGR